MTDSTVFHQRVVFFEREMTSMDDVEYTCCKAVYTLRQSYENSHLKNDGKVSRTIFETFAGFYPRSRDRVLPEAEVPSARWLRWVSYPK
jgi:hypothetical protein